MAQTRKAALAPGPAQSAQLRFERMAVEYQDAFEQRHTSGHFAPALDHGQRRVLVVAQRRLLSAQLPQPRHQFGFGIDTHSYRQRIDEQPHHAPSAVKGRSATGTGNAEHDVGFAAVAVQQQSPGSLQQQVDGYRSLARTLPEGGGEWHRQTDLMSS